MMNQDQSVRPRNQRGTTLLELLVAVAMLMLVSGAAFSLFNNQQAAATTTQGQIGLSLSLRNATSQLQQDLSNAGNGYFQGANIPSWPVGVTVQNNWVNYGSSCVSSGAYTANCFDQLNIITAQPSVYPAILFTDSLGTTSASTCPGTYNGSPNSATTIYGLPATGLTAAQTAAKFVAGDQLLFLSATGKALSTAILAANGGVNGNNNAVALSIYQTQIDGSNILQPSGYAYGDPLDITACDRSSVTVSGSTTSPACPPPPPTGVTPTVTFATNFCPGGYIIKLSPIQYYVAATADTQNPWQLVRQQNGITSVVMDQIVGFKIGAATWDAQLTSGYSTPYYNYNASTYCIGGTGVTCTGGNAQGWNFSLIRSVRLSIIARTPPNYSAAYKFRNSFDGGPYQVQGTAIVVNPRNLSMSDDQTLP